MNLEANFPYEAAEEISKVLEVGKEKGYPNGFWRTLPSAFHAEKAYLHLQRLLYPTVPVEPEEDHLAHALTRLAMAVSCRKIGK